MYLTVEEDAIPISDKEKRRTAMPERVLKGIIQQYLDDNYRLEEENKELKKVYFQMLAVNTKMNMMNSGLRVNGDISGEERCLFTHYLDMFDEAMTAKVPIKKWPQWIAARLSGKT